MLFLIKSRWTGSVLFSLDCGSPKLCVEAAVKVRANLAGANIAGANIAGANLTDANLTGANLIGANIAGAYLTGANLTGANLTDANLTGANIAGANLTDANLAGANLTDANLTDANLTGTKGFAEGHWLPQIQGSRHFIRMAGDRVLKIGRIAKPIEWWLENNVRYGEENNYTSDQIAEYRRYIELIAAMYPAETTATLEKVKHES